MSPRKKSKPNPKAAADASAAVLQGATEASNATDTSSTTSAAQPGMTTTPQDTPLTQSFAGSTTTSSSSVATTSTTTASGEQTLHKKASRKWLGGGGSWRSKAPAVAQLAKESIGSARGTTSELPAEEAKKAREDSPTKFLTKRKSSKGGAIPAAMTKLNVGSNGSVDEAADARQEAAAKKAAEPATPTIKEPPLPPEPAKPDPVIDTANTWGWRSWWSRPDGYTETGKSQETEDAQKTPLPDMTPSENVDTRAKELGSSLAPPNVGPGEDTEMKDAPTERPTEDLDTEMKDAPQSGPQAIANTSPARASWFWSWSSAQNAQTNPPPAATAPTVPETASTEEVTSQTEVPAQPNVPPEATEAPRPATPTPSQMEGRKASGWAFFFRDKPAESGKTSDEPHKKVGEVAVLDTPSQNNPEVAQFNEQEDTTKEPPKESLKEPLKEPPKELAKPVQDSLAKRSFRSLRGRPNVTASSKDMPADTPSSSKPVTPAKTSPAQSPTRLETGKESAQQVTKPPTKLTVEPGNLVLPEFHTTYRLVQKPTYWQQIRQYFLGGEAAMPHLHINPAPPRIKKALAIGVHGFFPAPIIQKVLGQPTGTSVRFANAAAAAIKEWTEARGYSAEIEQVALEGEGFIADRVNALWKLLLNWIDQVKQADFILVACHSQGVPVATMLVAKLIQFGCVNATRIGICAMAGVNMGPFIEYKTKYFGPTAAELFEFSKADSLVSQMYLAALDEVLRYGVRILYVGSIDDQLVSLDSSTFSTLSHPYIYRAVFIDGRIHAPGFLTHLVGFALKLRNLGLPDHGLIRELSPALAGSLYAGEGHSRVYEDPRVYTLAVQHALETTSLPINPTQQRPSTSNSFTSTMLNIPIPGAPAKDGDPYALKVKPYDTPGSANPNPYFLPWAMRGLLEEEFVKKELGEEVEELLGLFEGWKPVDKRLKDVRFRLEAVRSRL